MKAIFLVPYPENSAPSQRFRFEQYIDFLEERNVDYEIHPFIGKSAWKILYRKGFQFRKLFGIIGGFLRRILILGKIAGCEWVFIHREASPAGPPVFEWIIAKAFRKKIIYDFDDAIWFPNTSAANRAVRRLKWHSKVALICKWSYKISAGNSYLAGFARLHNSRTIINPTTIDTENYHNRIKNQYTAEPVIGWTGTHSTIKYLELAVPALQRLESIYHFVFVVIADRDPNLPLKSYRFISWDRMTEIDDLLQLNIGIMPLTDDAWAKGKCGFKILQYLALGIPAVASPVGINTEIIEDGNNGYLCASENDWYEKLKLLIRDPDLRYLLGRNGRTKIGEKYSVKSNKENFLSLFE